MSFCTHPYTGYAAKPKSVESIENIVKAVSFCPLSYILHPVDVSKLPGYPPIPPEPNCCCPLCTGQVPENAICPQALPTNTQTYPSCSPLAAHNMQTETMAMVTQSLPMTLTSCCCPKDLTAATPAPPPAAGGKGGKKGKGKGKKK